MCISEWKSVQQTKHCAVGQDWYLGTSWGSSLLPWVSRGNKASSRYLAPIVCFLYVFFVSLWAKLHVIKVHFLRIVKSVFLFTALHGCCLYGVYHLTEVVLQATVHCTPVHSACTALYTPVRRESKCEAKVWFIIGNFLDISLGPAQMFWLWKLLANQISLERRDNILWWGAGYMKLCGMEWCLISNGLRIACTVECHRFVMIFSSLN